MKTIAAILLLSCCAFGQDKATVSAAEAACGPQDTGFSVTPDDSRHPMLMPESNKALIYVVERATGVMRFGADGKWLGALKPPTSSRPWIRVSIIFALRATSLYGRACRCTR